MSITITISTSISVSMAVSVRAMAILILNPVIFEVDAAYLSNKLQWPFVPHKNSLAKVTVIYKLKLCKCN